METSRDCSILLEDLLPVFGRDAYFEESASPSCLYKWRERFAPNVTYRVSGKVDLDYMYGAPVKGNIPGAGAQSWIVACEDLGSAGDYDFNDIVLLYLSFVFSCKIRTFAA